MAYNISGSSGPQSWVKNLHEKAWKIRANHYIYSMQLHPWWRLAGDTAQSGERYEFISNCRSHLGIPLSHWVRDERGDLDNTGLLGHRWTGRRCTWGRGFHQCAPIKSEDPVSPLIWDVLIKKSSRAPAREQLFTIQHYILKNPKQLTPDLVLCLW